MLVFLRLAGPWLALLVSESSALLGGSALLAAEHLDSAQRAGGSRLSLKSGDVIDTLRNCGSCVRGCGTTFPRVQPVPRSVPRTPSSLQQ